MVSAKSTWFIYRNEQRQGPFTVEDLKQLASRGELAPEDFCWTEGMKDWEQIHKVDVLKSQLTPKAYAPPPPATPMPAAGPDDVSVLIHLNPQEVDDRTENIDRRKLRDAEREAAKAIAMEKKAAEKDKRAAPRSRSGSGGGIWGLLKLIFTFLFLTLVGTGIYLGYQAFMGDTGRPKRQGELEDDVVGKAISSIEYLIDSMTSPIPVLKDVSYDDFRALKEAATSKGAQKITLALSNAPLSSKLYLSGNVADGMQLTVHARAIPATLLRLEGWEGTGQVKFDHRLASVDLSQIGASGPPPIGRYEVQITDSTGKELGTRKVFLGGNEDETYRESLKKFSESLKKKASQELADLSTVSDRMLTHYQVTRDTFQKLLPKAAKVPGKRAWKAFDVSWNQSATGITEISQKLAADREAVLGNTIRAAGAFWQDVTKLHELQTQYFDQGGADTLQGPITELDRSSEKKAGELKNKLAFAGRAVSGDGSALREGL